jgi:hypothetical protein
MIQFEDFLITTRILLLLIALKLDNYKKNILKNLKVQLENHWKKRQCMGWVSKKSALYRNARFEIPWKFLQYNSTTRLECFIFKPNLILVFRARGW